MPGFMMSFSFPLFTLPLPPYTGTGAACAEILLGLSEAGVDRTHPANQRLAPPLVGGHDAVRSA